LGLGKPGKPFRAGGEKISGTPLDPHLEAVAWIGSKADVSEALRLMRSLEVGSLLVKEGEANASIVTERDVVMRLPTVMGVDIFVDAVRQGIFVER